MIRNISSNAHKYLRPMIWPGFERVFELKSTPRKNKLRFRGIYAMLDRWPKHGFFLLPVDQKQHPVRSQRATNFLNGIL